MWISGQYSFGLTFDVPSKMAITELTSIYFPLFLIFHGDKRMVMNITWYNPAAGQMLSFFNFHQVCRFCWHRIRTDENGLCPACRKVCDHSFSKFLLLYLHYTRLGFCSFKGMLHSHIHITKRPVSKREQKRIFLDTEVFKFETKFGVINFTVFLMIILKLKLFIIFLQHIIFYKFSVRLNLEMDN